MNELEEIMQEIFMECGQWCGDEGWKDRKLALLEEELEKQIKLKNKWKEKVIVISKKQ